MSKNIFKLKFNDGKANIICHTDKTESQAVKDWEDELNFKCIESKKVYEYLGRYWEFKYSNKMHQNYEGWKYGCFQLIDKEKGKMLENVKYKNGKLNKLSDDIHIAIEIVSNDPKGKDKFNQLFVAFKDFDNWQGELPEWNDNYLN